MAGLGNTISIEAITVYNSSRMKHYKDDPNPDPDHGDNLDKITSIRYTPPPLKSSQMKGLSCIFYLALDFD